MYKRVVRKNDSRSNPHVHKVAILSPNRIKPFPLEILRIEPTLNGS